ncbi:MAG: hypothetical protein CME70_10975 [Halobacteriovorax sp.]|nr:hypothetical protein [Halobacteriovorax sp.]|tara:strand:+ start:32328 stop:33296 length:969 start_codon:yes stop_codon:yes gene_type:complete
MFEYLPEVCKELNANMQELYWILIVPFTLITIILEFFKLPEGNPNVSAILKRVVISIILLISFDQCINAIAMVGDGVANRIHGLTQLSDLMKHLEQNYNESEVSWLKFREAVIFILNLLSYIIAYVGVFVANVLVHFVWSVLYVCSPLMILMYISGRTSFVTSNLYKGLINVVTWKILWSILGVMLLKLATSPAVGDWDNFLTSILVNLCIGLSMLFIPFTTKSLINDGMSGAASALAAAPTFATGKVVTEFAKKQGRRVGKGTMQGTANGFNRMGTGMKSGLTQARSHFSQKMKTTPPAGLPKNVIKVDFNNRSNKDDPTK